MNIDFKILWFEDQVSWRPSPERKLNDFVRQHSLNPIITWRKGDEGDVEEQLQKDYDLILMDYDLRNITGKILIDHLRAYDVYTDVLFYSGKLSEMLKSLCGVDKEGNVTVIPVDGVYFADRKSEQLYPKMQKVVDKIVRRVQDIINLRGIVLDNVSAFEAQMQNILILAINKFSKDQMITLNQYVKNKIVKPSKIDYTGKMDTIETSTEVLKAVVESQDYLIDSYKKARIVGRILKVLKNSYGRGFDDKYNNFADKYNNEIIKYRNALGHAMRSNENDREEYIGEIDKVPVIFNEDLFRKLRSSITEYQLVISDIEKSFNDI